MLFRILLTDDEQPVSDWLESIIVERYADSVEVYKATNAVSSLKLLSCVSFDIAILDINMPETDGLALMEELAVLSPDTKIIFLTGMQRFDYARRALSRQVLAYVLKTDDDDVLLDAVGKAMKQVERDVEQRELMEKAAAVFESAAPVLKHDFLLNLLNGHIGREAVECTGFLPVRLAIDAFRPAKLMICFLGKGSRGMEYTQRMQRLFAADEALVAALKPNFVFEHTMPGDNNWVWLIQKRAGDWDDAAETILRLALEQAQKRLDRGMGENLGIILGERTVMLEEAASYFAELRPLIGYSAAHCFELLSERDIARNEAQPQSKPGPVYDPIFQKGATLQCLLEKGEREAFLSLLREVLTTAVSRPDYANAIAAEIFTSISSVFLSYLNKTGLMQSLSRQMSTYELVHFEANKSRSELMSYYEKVAGFLFDRQQEQRETRASQAVAIARDYILRNLNKDLSLITLADKVYMNPSYFSVLFKARMGMNVSQFVKQERLKLAKQYLGESKYKINRISAILGFNAPAYFTKFFKSETHISPQEYRDNILLGRGAADERE